MTVLLFAFLAGALSTLNPCVLPMIPLIFVGAVSEHRWGAIWLSAGLVVSFTALGAGLALMGSFVVPTTEGLRYGAAGLLLVSGWVMVSPKAQGWWARLAAPMAGWGNRHLGEGAAAGRSGPFWTGLLLGVVWSPCVGPTLGAAVAAAAQGENLGRTTVVMATFGMGMATVFVLVAGLLRTASKARRARWTSGAAKARTVFGWALIAVGILVLSGLDKVLEALALRAMPDWLLGLTTRF